MSQNIYQVVTLNVLNDLSRWDIRAPLILAGIRLLQPDWVLLQEVNLKINNGMWLANQLGFTYVFTSPKSGIEGRVEGLSILSRYPFAKVDVLNLESQNRVAQLAEFHLEEGRFFISNCHLYWQPGNSPSRVAQTQRLLGWLENKVGTHACILGGDFNATPDLPEIAMIKSRFRSAYETIHTEEPEYTCPTPLPRSFWPTMRTFLGFFFLLRPRHLKKNWRGTLDYLFVSPAVKLLDSEITLNVSDPNNPKIYPSDHFGLTAKFRLGDL